MILKAATIVIAGQDIDVSKFSSQYSVTNAETQALLEVNKYIKSTVFPSSYLLSSR